MNAILIYSYLRHSFQSLYHLASKHEYAQRIEETEIDAHNNSKLRNTRTSMLNTQQEKPVTPNQNININIQH